MTITSRSRLDVFLLALLVTFSGASWAATRTVAFDTLLIGGSILDGTGTPMKRADAKS